MAASTLICDREASTMAFAVPPITVRESPVQLVQRFSPTAFNPPAWLKNPHMQTIWGAEVMQSAIVGVLTRTQAEPIYDTRERWETEDGDFIDLDLLFAKLPACRQGQTRPVVITCHGLESCATALLPRSMAKAFARRGFDTVALNFRGCSGEDNNKAYSYHLGWTRDLIYVIDRLHREQATRPIYLSGFSLGGNVILKALGELGPKAPHYNIRGAAVSSVPFDASRSSRKLDSGFNRVIYVSNFLRTLKLKAERTYHAHCTPEKPLFDIQSVRRCSRIGDFDNEVIARLHGFRDKDDYYRQSDSRPYLPRIQVPTLVIQSLDDPFIDEKGLPRAEELPSECPVRLLYHPYGGHCGFLTGKLARSEEDRWLPKELASFLEYIEAARQDSVAEA